MQSTRFGRQQRGDGQRDGVGRHFIQAAEMAFAHLLLARNLVQAHDLYPDRIVKLGEWRIIEGDMPVLADAHGAEIGGMCAQQRRHRRRSPPPAALRGRSTG